MGSQEGGIPGLAGIHKSAFNSRIDMVVSLPGDVQTEVHSCRSNPYGYSPCYAKATWSKICREVRFTFIWLLLSPNRARGKVLLTVHKYVIMEY